MLITRGNIGNCCGMKYVATMVNGSTLCMETAVKL